MITKRYKRSFSSQARTLPRSYVSDNKNVVSGTHSKTHASGWTIKGEVHEDYYTWVNEFFASHPTLGQVFGNFESVVKASSKEALDDFLDKHPPEEWDYLDI